MLQMLQQQKKDWLFPRPRVSSLPQEARVPAVQEGTPEASALNPGAPQEASPAPRLEGATQLTWSSMPTESFAVVHDEVNVTQLSESVTLVGSASAAPHLQEEVARKFRRAGMNAQEEVVRQFRRAEMNAESFSGRLTPARFATVALHLQGETAMHFQRVAMAEIAFVASLAFHQLEAMTRTLGAAMTTYGSPPGRLEPTTGSHRTMLQRRTAP